MGVVKRLRPGRGRRFMQEVFVLYFAVQDARTPVYAKLVALFSLLYLLSPIDLLPDFIPFIGYLDDLLIVPTLLHLAFRLLPEQVIENSQLKAIKHKRKVYIAVVVLFLLLLLILTCIFLLGKSILHKTGLMP